MSDLAHVLAQMDAIGFTVAAAIVTYILLNRKRRPITRSRAFDVGLSTILFVVLGLRFATLAVVAIALPHILLPAATSTTVSMFAGLCAAASVAGFVTHRGSVGWRAIGAGALAAASIMEVSFRAAYAPFSILGVLDAAVSVATAAATALIAAYFWIYRTATPSPLGRDKRPFDY